jgi:hypothetical protein
MIGRIYDNEKEQIYFEYCCLCIFLGMDRLTVKDRDVSEQRAIEIWERAERYIKNRY